MKRILTAISVLFVCLRAEAQVTFQKTYGGIQTEGSSSVEQTLDGGYIITGNTYSFGAGDMDIYLIKTDVYGDTLWTKTYGGTSLEVPWCVEQTADSGYIITGHTQSYGAGLYDAFLLKTDINGGLIWFKVYGGSDYDYGSYVRQTNDGGYILCGHTYSFGTGLTDVYVIKTNSIGDTLWTRTIGGSSFDMGRCIQQTSDGGYIVAGSSSSFSAGYKVYLVKLNAAGTVLWTKTLGSSNDDQAYFVRQTNDGGFIIAGLTLRVVNGDRDAYLIKTDSGGMVQWAKAFSGSSHYNDEARSVWQTNDGGFIVAGIYNQGLNFSDIYLIRTDLNGDTLWTKAFGGADYDFGWSVEQTTDNGFIISGVTRNFGAGSDDVFLIKTDSNGAGTCNEVVPVATVLDPVITIGSGGFTTNTSSVITNPVIQINSTYTQASVLCLSTNVFVNTAPEDIINVFPNPATSELVVWSSEFGDNAEITIYNILDKKVDSKQLVTSNKKPVTVDVSQLSPGIYFVRAKTDKGISVAKFVKE